MNKNLLSENMLRFGTKNLSEGAKRNLVLESVMETIKEHGLHNEVKRRLNEGSAADKAKLLYNAYGGTFGNDKEAQVVSTLASIANVSELNQVGTELKKLTGGQGIFQWIGSFMQGTDITNPDLWKAGGGSVLDHLMRLWYPAKYKEQVYDIDFKQNPWSFLNLDRSLYQKFQSGNKMGSTEDTSLKRQYSKD